MRVRKYVKHTGKVSATKGGGRQIQFMHDGKKIKVRVSGSHTAIMVDGKKAKRKAVAIGMICTFNYPGNNTQAKNIDCKP